MWTSDSYALRGNRASSYDRDMHVAVLEAERWAGAQTTPIITTPPPQPQPTKQVNYRVQVTVQTFLRVRAGAGTNFTEIRTLQNGAEVTIIRESDGAGAMRWGQMPDGGWIALDHTRQLDLVQEQPTTPPPVPADVWRVQIGAFRERAGAETTVAAAIAAGYYAYLNSYGGFYRAQIGAENTKAAADAIAARLHADTALAKALHLPQVKTLVKVA